MNYTKPEVAVLGEAVNVIERIGPKPGTVKLDGNQFTLPAYDLDE